MTQRIVLSNISARNLGRLEDPYVVFRVRDSEGRTTHKTNNGNPDYGDETVTLDFTGSFPVQLSVRVYDRDQQPNPDDLLGSTSIRISGRNSTARVNQRITRRSPTFRSPRETGQVSFTFTLSQPSVKQIQFSRMNLTLAPHIPGGQDTYIRFTVGDEREETTVLWNANTRDFGDENVTLTLPTSVDTVQVEVWDRDLRSADDLLGSAEIAIESGLQWRQGLFRLELEGTSGLNPANMWRPAGTLTVAVAISRPDGTFPGPGGTPLPEPPRPEPNPDPTPAPPTDPTPAPPTDPTPAPPTDPTPPTPPPAPTPPPPAPSTVERKAIHRMPRSELNRYIAAVQRMIDTRQFDTVAGYHGYPGRYCAHAQETFPGWHRAYILDFEKRMQAADRELGNDGYLGLPYWDWTEIDNVTDRNEDLLPIEFKRAFRTKPANVGSLHTGAQNLSYLQEYGRSLQIRLRNIGLTNRVEEMFALQQHFEAASKRRSGFSVETPHDNIHGALGPPMNNINFAAYHPIFWLHHCNVDRLYEGYLQEHTIANCRQEFINNQRERARRGLPNLYEQDLEPFELNGRPFRCDDTFDISALGYSYDAIPTLTTGNMMREEPTYVMFKEFDANKYANRPLTLHVLLVPKTVEGYSNPSSMNDIIMSEYFAGSEYIFGSKGENCENCGQRIPYNVSVDVTSYLRSNGLTRDSYNIVVMVEEEIVEEGKAPVPSLKPIQAVQPALPKPEFSGPVFADREAMLSKVDKEEDSGDVRKAQEHLAVLGFYKGKHDGYFGPNTQEAVKAYQKAYELKVDGIVGPNTKHQLSQVLTDTTSDDSDDLPGFKKEQTVKYWVGDNHPARISHEAFCKEVAEAFEMWGTKTKVTFTQVEDHKAADLLITFAIEDDAGGMLAEAHKEGIRFDSSEHWLLQHEAPPAKKKRFVRFLPVLLHEIGHLYGLKHTHNKESIMYPYYRGNFVEISESDYQLANAALK
eukprot:m.21974 g.21974  ORF g.21974 m.21974 type:complete len:973 (-) comp7306_c0_seq1:76-2994(-)